MTRNREHDMANQAESLSRRKLLGAAAGAGAGLLGALPDQALAAGPAPRAKRIKVIFVVHDNNPFFVPVRLGFEQFGHLAGWKTQWVGPPHQSTVDTVNLQASAL